jgi:putative transposase
MAYATDITDEQWAVIAPIVTYRSDQDRYNGGRPRTVDLRQVVDALLYQARTGVQWRLLPTEFPPSGTVRYYFDTWTWDGTWIAINDVVREQVRMAHGRSAEPSAARIDRHTVQTTDVGGERGYDGGKKDRRSETTHSG